MKILNLYAGVGGNAEKWDGITHEITHVEIDPKIAAVLQTRKPGHIVIVADAHKFLLHNFNDFDIIWGSPPCQSHTKMIRSGRNRKPTYPDFKMYEEIMLLTSDFKGVWVYENVVPYYTPLLPPKAKLGRHLFWSNVDISPFDAPKFEGLMSRQTVKDKQDLHNWLGIHYPGNIYYGNNHCPTQVLRNCVHPLVGEHVLNCLLKNL